MSDKDVIDAIGVLLSRSKHDPDLWEKAMETPETLSVTLDEIHTESLSNSQV